VRSIPPHFCARGRDPDHGVRKWCEMLVVRALKISQLTDGGMPPTYDSMHLGGSSDGYECTSVPYPHTAQGMLKIEQPGLSGVHRLPRSPDCL
jgi:hypothetical protein